MCPYFQKSEDKTFEAMKQVAKEALKRNKSEYEKMKAIAKTYIPKRECSVKQAVHLVTPELWLYKILPPVTFLNSNLPEKCYRFFKKKAEIDELPDDSTDIFQVIFLIAIWIPQTKMLRMVNIKILINFVLQFLSLYYIDDKTKNRNVLSQGLILLNYMSLLY